MSGLDLALFYWINRTGTSPFLDSVMPVLTNSRVWAVVLVLMAVWLSVKGGRRGRLTAILLVAALSVSDLTAARILKPAFGRERPCRSLSDVRVLGHCGGRYGFPSNHATNAGVITAVLGLFYPPTLVVVPALALGVAYSRVYVGVHYPGDVVAGLLYGLLLGTGFARSGRRKWLKGGSGEPKPLHKDAG